MSKNPNKTKTFQHYHVFVTHLNFAFVERLLIYLILILEVKVNYTKNLINLNKKYESNLQKVVIFNVTSAFLCSGPEYI
jgi:hypothetical protein